MEQGGQDGYYYLNWMEDSDGKIRQQLVTATQLFAAGKFAQCRKVLGEVKLTHQSIELNKLIAEVKDSPGKLAAIYKKIITLLSQYNPDTAIQPPSLPSEMYYWNAVVLSQLMGQSEVTELVSEVGIRHAKAFRTETTLMLAYSLLSAKEKAGILASCLSVINTAAKITDRNSSLGELEKAYCFMIQVMQTRVLLKLNFVEAAKIAFMMRFNQAPESKEELELCQASGVSVGVHQQLLHAQIEYHSGSHQQAIKILSELHTQLDGRNKDFLKAVIDHNIAIILTQFSKSAASQALLRKSLKYLTTAEQLENHNQRHSMILKCKENLILTGLLRKGPMLGNLYEGIKDCGSLGSYKQSYRKAEVCIKYYQQLLTEQPRILLNKDVHDSYEPVYFYPNQPYFQHKGKNKNPTFTNGRAYYRRYVMPEWEGQPGANLIFKSEEQRGGEVKQEKKKEKEKQKSSGRNAKGKRQQEPQKQPQTQTRVLQKSKLSEVLASAESYLKQSLTFLEKQAKVLLIMDNEHKQLTSQANANLHTQYTNYKSNIYSLLTYVKLNQREWAQAYQLTEKYLKFALTHMLSTIPTHYRTYYSVLVYRMEALCELGRMSSAYDAVQEAAHMLDYFDNENLVAISTSSQQAGQSYQQEMSKLANFYYNLAVVHSRDNKIPEVFQAIQKLMQQLGVVPSSPQAHMSLSTLEMLIHYNMRTGNTSSALQLLKRRRILTHTGAISHHNPPALNITK